MLPLVVVIGSRELHEALRDYSASSQKIQSAKFDVWQVSYAISTPTDTGNTEVGDFGRYFGDLMDGILPDEERVVVVPASLPPQGRMGVEAFIRSARSDHCRVVVVDVRPDAALHALDRVSYVESGGGFDQVVDAILGFGTPVTASGDGDAPADSGDVSRAFPTEAPDSTELWAVEASTEEIGKVGETASESEQPLTAVSAPTEVVVGDEDANDVSDPPLGIPAFGASTFGGHEAATFGGHEHDTAPEPTAPVFPVREEGLAIATDLSEDLARLETIVARAAVAEDPTVLAVPTPPQMEVPLPTAPDLAVSAVGGGELAKVPPVAADTGAFGASLTPVPPPPAFATARHQSATPGHRGTVIAVWSSKGGVGKTTVALALGIHLRKSRGAEVAILDLDIESGDLRARMSAKGSDVPNVTGLVASQDFSSESVDKWMWTDEYGVRALFAPTRVVEAVSMSTQAIPAYRSIIATLRGMVDVVVLDCGESAADSLFARVALPEADGLCVVIDNERAAVVGMRTTLDSFGQMAGLVAPSNTCLVLNQKVEKVGVSEATIRSLFEPIPVVASLADNRGHYTGLSSSGTYIVDHPGEVGEGMRKAMDSVIEVLCPTLEQREGGIGLPGGSSTSQKPPGFFKRLAAEDPILRRLIKSK